MKRMLLTISYDGTAYHGWQVQPNGITVQETVQNGLEKVIGVRPALTGCSRTDAGVHAKEFCCHFDCEDKFPLSTFTKGLNSALPSDIAVMDCREVPSDFHARYYSLGKTYLYRIDNGIKKNPFLSRYTWHIERELHLEAINRFCEKMIGKHDFIAFSSSGRTVEDTVRTVFECSAERKGDIIEFKISADGFLYNMVRIIVGTAIDVSDGRIKLKDIENIFDSKDRSKAGVTAPPNGLFLEKVLY